MLEWHSIYMQFEKRTSG